MKKEHLRVIPLGGLGEIGKNITAIEYEDEIMVIDCGISFPDEDMYGIDLVIPDIKYLLDKKDNVISLFLTHVNEDHIVTILYILKQKNMPIYGTKITIGLVKSKLKEHNMLSKSNLNSIVPGEIINLNKLSIEFIRVTHSIAESCALAIHTPIGIVLHTG